jgi:RNA methyltransferase, TrmH family
MELSQRRALLIGRLRSRKSRAREGLVLVEGVRAVREALAAGARSRFAVVSPRLGGGDEGARLDAALAETGIDVATVTDEDLTRLTDTDQPQGVLIVCEETAAAAPPFRTGGRYLALDSIQDPGNAGTLIRAAVAFALDGVIVLSGTVDPWGAKAVRASAGMVFRMPITKLSLPEVASGSREAGVPLWIAEGGGEDVRGVHPRGGFALVLGNEGAGVRPEMEELAERRVAVAMRGGAESLNVGVAGSILLHELTRERSLD